jgi:hypothetical protein
MENSVVVEDTRHKIFISGKKIPIQPYLIDCITRVNKQTVWCGAL